jgi:glycosyltransferase involved in cell wall biosynthesis
MGDYFKYCKGGAELQAYFIAKTMTKNMKVHYIFIKNPEHFKSKKLQRIDDGIILHPLKRLNYGIFHKFFFLHYWELSRLLDDLNPDLIYQRGVRAHVGIVVKWCKRNNKKLVLGISSEANCSRRGILDLNNFFLSYPFKILDSFLSVTGLKNADIIVAQNHIQQKLLLQNFNRDSIIIPNGHPIPLSPIKKSDLPIVCWIANIKENKQPQLFIKLADKCRDLNVKFVFAGRPGKGSCQRNIIEETKKVPNLTYLGELPLKKTNELLLKSSLFVNTSIIEGFPNTFIQAWMRENPVVSLNCDPDDIIKSYKIGYHSGKFEQLTKDVRYLLENEEIRKKMGKKAREYAIKNHNIEKISKQYLEVFNKLLY